MEHQENGYHTSFFKPTSKSARLNRNMVILFVSIWAFAVFGFQIALKILEKPVPEETFIQWENVWENVSSGEASSEELQVFAQVSLSVLGKNFIDPAHRSILDNGLSWSLLKLADSATSQVLITKIQAFESLKAEIQNLTNPEYIAAKKELAAIAGPVLGLYPGDVRNTLVSAELILAQTASLNKETIKAIPEVMSLYLIHNQSFLTDFQFLGFPFHYFYASIFLLVLFVGLCLMYCIQTDKNYILLGVED